MSDTAPSLLFNLSEYFPFFIDEEMKRKLCFSETLLISCVHGKIAHPPKNMFPGESTSLEKLEQDSYSEEGDEGLKSPASSSNDFYFYFYDHERKKEQPSDKDSVILVNGLPTLNPKRKHGKSLCVCTDKKSVCSESSIQNEPPPPSIASSETIKKKSLSNKWEGRCECVSSEEMSICHCPPDLDNLIKYKSLTKIKKKVVNVNSDEVQIISNELECKDLEDISTEKKDKIPFSISHVTLDKKNSINLVDLSNEKLLKTQNTFSNLIVYENISEDLVDSVMRKTDEVPLSLNPVVLDETVSKGLVDTLVENETPLPPSQVLLSVDYTDVPIAKKDQAPQPSNQEIVGENEKVSVDLMDVPMEKEDQVPPSPSQEISVRNEKISVDQMDVSLEKKEQVPQSASQEISGENEQVSEKKDQASKSSTQEISGEKSSGNLVHVSKEKIDEFPLSLTGEAWYDNTLTEIKSNPLHEMSQKSRSSLSNLTRESSFLEKISLDLEFEECLNSMISTENSTTTGGITISVQCVGVHAEKFTILSSSQYMQNGYDSGLNLLSTVDMNLHTIEENRSEHKKDENYFEENIYYISMCEGGYQCTYTHKIGESKKFENKVITFQDAYDFILDGANIVLLRYFALTKFEGTFSSKFTNMKGELCTSVIITRIVDAIVNNTEMKVLKVYKRKINHKGFMTSECMILTLSGHLVKRQFSDSIYVIHINPLLPVDLETKQLGIQIALRDNWKNDMQLLADYFDFKERELMENETYLAGKAQLQAMLTDYFQTILLMKPREVMSFTKSYFSNFSRSVKLPHNPYFDKYSHRVRYSYL